MTKPNVRLKCRAPWRQPDSVVFCLSLCTLEVRLTQLCPPIEELFELSDFTRLSLGVLHQETPVYAAHLGRKKGLRREPPKDDNL